MPHRHPFIGVHHAVHRGPPGRVVGGAHHRPQRGPGDRPTDRGVQVRRQAPLRLHRREVLHLVRGAAAQVLPEPVQQAGEQQGIQRGPPVVVGVRVDRHPVADPPVGGQRQREEHRRPEGVAGDRVHVGAPDRAGRHRLRRQIGEPLHAAGGTAPARTRWPTVSGRLGVGLVRGVVVRVGWLGLVGQVPAFTALLHAQRPRPLRAGRTPRLAGRPARQRNRDPFAALPVQDLTHQGPHTDPVAFGGDPHHRRRDPARHGGLVDRRSWPARTLDCPRHRAHTPRGRATKLCDPAS